MSDVLRVANVSGFYGDRASAMREMLTGGPVDVLTGDYLAELTMLILAKDKQRRDRGGYARTVLAHLEDVLGTCLDRGVKVVVNAGGLAPASCAEDIEKLGARLGLAPRVAWVDGDDLLPRLDELRRAGESLVNSDTGIALGDQHVLCANAYLGGFGIAAALDRGADIVITGRVTDASLVVGAAASHFGWNAHDLDALAGATAAGHVIECGPQATGGNYALFHEVTSAQHLGYPLALIEADGSATITKHPGTDGLVSVGTVTAQLVYEIGSPAYVGPDVVAHFDTLALEQVGPDAVRISGTRGTPPPATFKALLQVEGGVRNAMTFGITGLDPERKAAVLESALWSGFPAGRDSFEATSTELFGRTAGDPGSNAEALSFLRIAVRDADRDRVSVEFPARLVELGLASYPGYFFLAPPGKGSDYGVVWPTLVAVVHVGGERHVIPRVPLPDVAVPVPGPVSTPARPAGAETVQVPLGRVVSGRAGDKGSHANVGVWGASAEAYSWLSEFLTEDRFRELLPDLVHLVVRRFELPNVLALNFLVEGLLEGGAAACLRVDNQAKGLAEYLRAKVVDVPRALVDDLPR